MHEVEFVGIPQIDNENLINMVKAIGVLLIQNHHAPYLRMKKLQSN